MERYGRSGVKRRLVEVEWDFDAVNDHVRHGRRIPVEIDDPHSAPTGF
jgi:hypothetical protein